MRAELTIDGGNIRLSGKSVIHPFAESLDKHWKKYWSKDSTSIRPPSCLPCPMPG
ncbi:hypothetical protein [Neisseria gonorrhoeae]|uniref:hypothetical protein n=1 Tax=Neisseria gonorrhoeae TaxID=485 RepID=UPI0018E039BA|nr:hypothetical protein [Neisseria gonorrhoeae]